MPGFCCCGASSATCTSCATSTAPLSYQVVLATYTGGGGCSGGTCHVDGTYVLDYDSPCTWIYDNLAGTADDGCYARKIELVLTDFGTHADYTLTITMRVATEDHGYVSIGGSGDYPRDCAVVSLSMTSGLHNNPTCTSTSATATLTAL